MRAITTANTVKYASARAHFASLNGKDNASHAVLFVASPYAAAYGAPQNKKEEGVSAPSLSKSDVYTRCTVRCFRFRVVNVVCPKLHN